MDRLEPTHPVGVIGGGTMGAGIAQVALLAGHRVLVHDADPTVAKRAVDAITGRLDRLVAKGKLEPWARAWAVDRLAVAETVAHLAPCALVIEAVTESLAVKRAVFAAVETAVSAETVLATNTSSLSVTAIAAELARPERLVGLHFFNPAPLLPLVEVVSGLATAPAVADLAYNTVQAWGKVPVRTRSTPGFIVNRIARPFYGEALRACEENVADPATLDAVFRESGGFPMGPLELVDLIGLDVNLAVSESVWAAFGQDPRYAPSPVQREYVAAGWLGRKTGRGFYRYGSKEARPEPTLRPAAGTPPERVEVHGGLGPASELVALAREAGVEVVEAVPGSPTSGQLVLADGTPLLLTDGALASWHAARRGRPVVLFDLALDYRTASLVALAPSTDCPPESLALATAFFQALGKRVAVVRDTPGLLVARTVARLVNEAHQALEEQVASAADLDLAMVHGVNYPLGPLAWGERLGAWWVRQLLKRVGRVYADGRYRCSVGLERAAQADRAESVT